MRAAKWLGLLGAAVLAAALLGGCGGTAQPAGTPSPAGSSSPSTTPAPAETSPAGTPQAGGKGVLRVSVYPIAQTDPAYISSNGEVLIANQVYDYLVDIDANNQIEPRIATDWRHSSDGLIYTFTLASGVRFHDGTPMTSQDVVWTFNRLRNTPGLPTETLYTEIEDVAATGDLTVTFTLSQTNPFFLYDLSDNHALIIKNGITKTTGFNGTGPFVVTDYRPADRIVMAANPDYFVEGEPQLDGLEVIFFNDASAAAAALRSGQLDLSVDLTTPLYKSLQQASNLVAQDVPTNQFAAVRIRVDMPPGNDPRVVKALKLATDRTAIFQLVQQGYGAVGHDTPIGPVFKTYYTPDPPVPARDPQAAKQLLTEAGYPNGLDMTLNLPNTLNFPDLAAAIQNQWAEAGINVTINAEPESVYYGQNGWLEVPLGITGWGDRPYPQFYLDVMLTCGAIWNETRFCRPDFDALVETAGTTLDEQTRINAYHEIQRILVEDGPMIVPYFFAQYGVMSDRFAGLQLKAFSGRTDLRVIHLAGAGQP